MLPQVFSFIAAISTEVAPEEFFCEHDMFCHFLLAFFDFMVIPSYNEWNNVAAHTIRHWKPQS